MTKPNLIIPQLTSNDIKRFWGKVAPPNAQGCRLWIAGHDEDGYGVFNLRHDGKKKNYRAHRVAYFIYTGQQPNELMVCHNCPEYDRPPCITESHLFLGTALDNNRDAKNKGRMATGDKHGSHTHPERVARGDRHCSQTHPERRPRGEGHGLSKLTEKNVIEIRKKYRPITVGSYLLAEEYGVSQSVIMQVIKRKTWTHI